MRGQREGTLYVSARTATHTLCALVRKSKLAPQVRALQNIQRPPVFLPRRESETDEEKRERASARHGGEREKNCYKGANDDVDGAGVSRPRRRERRP